MSQSGCGMVSEGLDKYNGLIEAYQDARQAAANGSVTIAMGFNSIQNYMDMYNSYLSADVAKTKAYRDALTQYGTKFKEQMGQYVDSSGQPISPNKLDLNELVKNKATPADMALNVQVYASTFNEAPLEKVDVESLKNTQRLVDEKYNQIFAGIKDWNDAVTRYNKERNKISGDIVGTLTQKLGVKELPPELPLYTMNVNAPMPKAQSFGK